ncbi:DNA-directed RNA polymerase subunit beta [Carnobacterium divergens]|uniref:DNA-directed RNA polymerase subunit beta n=2 Tax=Carnobacteriaceae TaxID=186828 RepID=A0A5F0N4M0_CARDV|nr:MULTISPECIES: DNA-directed RNA polymerase subunit beta [Carnobacterium]MCO6018378.1 DNA-directed RNA polymerase subunit beta [Carnobacterium divergens]MDV8933961.1 DNA-directed RNA polymerase subunit beta [Carnobacterium sp.]MPQ22050.1 DNA-directed RNA polymerase subunit beta [Carnobacterium divergens]TFI64872.1 DNA-directed RNA polymerase subunit beta [Carnobacterium divergens]TFI75761.1 DNA-directed RNA polymerase subunit beta [Carnobacterium divergens]
MPFALKVLIVLVLIIMTFLIGAMIGFGVLGDGNPFAVFSSATWKHIFSYFSKGT